MVSLEMMDLGKEVHKGDIRIILLITSYLESTILPDLLLVMVTFVGLVSSSIPFCKYAIFLK
jgi:hypothetical protein